MIYAPEQTDTKREALCDGCLRRPAGHGHFGLYCPECAELPAWANAAYCGTFPARDHSGCASSVECTA